MPERLQHDLQIEPDRPVRNIVDVVLDAALQQSGIGDLPSVTAHLREARDTRLDEMPRPIGLRDQTELLVVLR